MLPHKWCTENCYLLAMLSATQHLCVYTWLALGVILEVYDIVDFYSMDH